MILKFPFAALAALALLVPATAGAEDMTKPVEIQSEQDPAATTSSVDIATNLDRAAANSGQKLDWRHSIVDLMKALGMDAGLSERKELAAELNYSGDEHDSARMNMFLHKALMKKLSENGGKVPRERLFLVEPKLTAEGIQDKGAKTRVDFILK